MQLVKGLLLGSVATFATVACAQAADLPSAKSAPVKYVQVCDSYGAGFWYIPGTDICMKVGGIVQARYTYTSASNLLSLSQTYKQVANTLPSAAVTPSAYAQNYQFSHALDTDGTYMRTYINMDVRDQTPYGTLRAYILMSLINYGGQAFASGSVNGSFAAATPQTTNIGSGFSGTSPSISQGIIQFAGITAGRAVSMAGFYKEANTWGSDLLEEADTVNLLAYTATFGGGFSATLSLEDSDYHDPGASGLDQNIFASGFTPGAGALGHQGIVISEGNYRLPDFVGVIRLDQSWGAIQISGALHQVATQAIAGTAAAGVPPVGGTVPNASPATTPGVVTAPESARTMGYAGIVGAEFNLPQIAAGDQLWLEAAYADGALDYAGVDTQDDGNLSTDAVFGVTRLLSGLERFDRDAIAVPNAVGTGYSLEREKAWSLLGDYLHHWTPNWRSNIYANYINVTPGTVTQNTDWTEGGLSKANELRVGGNLIWTPTTGLDIGVDVMYIKLNQHLTANPGAIPTPLPVSTSGRPIVAVSPNAFSATLRLQRSF